LVQSFKIVPCSEHCTQCGESECTACESGYEVSNKVCVVSSGSGGGSSPTIVSSSSGHLSGIFQMKVSVLRY